MALRDIITETDAPERVEQYTINGRIWVVVRWDFGPIKTFVRKDAEQTVVTGRGLKRRSILQMIEEEPQGELVDTGLIAFSENRYNGIPVAEKVVADITADLDLRYGESPSRPEVDFDYYREAIAAFGGVK